MNERKETKIVIKPMITNINHDQLLMNN